MPRYTDESKDRVREAVDMVDLVGQRTDLRRAGTRFVGLCPFHEERTPSFSVNAAEKLYYCFGCGASGDAITFVRETQGLDFIGALEHLADRYGVRLEPVEEDPEAAARRQRRERVMSLLERAAGYYSRYLWESGEAAGAREYLSGRRLEDRVLQEFRVGFAPNAWDRLLLASRRAGFGEEELAAAGLARRGRSGAPYDPFRGRIVFPLADLRGRIVGFGGRAMRDGQGPKYVNTAESEVFHKSRQLYGADRARAQAVRSGAVVLAEGYTDVIALHQAGITNAVGVMGTSLTEHQVDELAKLLAHSDGAQVLLALDADKAGQAAMVRAARVAAGRRLDLRVVELPPGADPADLLQQEGPEALARRFSRSVPFVRFQVDRALEGSEHAGAEEKDRILADLRPVLGPLPPSALREELLRLLSAKLDLPGELVGTVIGGGRASQPARPAERGRSEAPAAPVRSAAARLERVERDFLALCLALPGPAAARLASVDPEEHFCSPLARRAAQHLRSHLATPLDGLPGDDEELRAYVIGLESRAAQMRGRATEPMLEVEALQLELLRLDRAIARGGLVADLAAERQAVRSRIAELSGT